jgi:hypothetical protein
MANPYIPRKPWLLYEILPHGVSWISLMIERRGLETLKIFVGTSEEPLNDGLIKHYNDKWAEIYSDKTNAGGGEDEE